VSALADDDADLAWRVTVDRDDVDVIGRVPNTC